jgi:hypothetical protein
MTNELNMNEKSKVINLCDYPISWQRITQIGDEYIKANATMYILNSELETQKDSGNRFISGTDGLGSHAEVYIDNPALRERLGFDDPNEKRIQLFVDEAKCKEILELKTPTFKKKIAELILTNQEKLKIIEVARKTKLNDFDKIQILEEHCNIKFK